MKCPSCGWDEGNTTTLEAALAAKDAEIEAIQAGRVKSEEIIGEQCAEIARLREALEKIARWANDDHDIVEVARAALNPRPLADKPKAPPR